MKVNANDRIDLIVLLKKLYISRKLILKSFLLAVLIGVAISLLLPVKYSSSTIFVTQRQDNSSTSLSGVASLVGINLGALSLGGEISSSMYPQISQSPKFKRLLLKKVLNDKNNLTVKDFLIKHYKFKDEKESNISYLGMSEVEEKCFKKLSEIISVSVNQKDGFITIVSTMPVAEYSAMLAKFSREILQDIIIKNKIETAKQNLIFSEKQLTEKKEEFDEVYSKLAYYSDSNLNSVNSFIINEKNKLESEFEIISAVVGEISRQVEQAKLQVSKDTPVFSTIQEAIIPIKKTSPKRTIIVVIFSIIGILFSSLYIVFFEPLKKLFLEF